MPVCRLTARRAARRSSTSIRLPTYARPRIGRAHERRRRDPSRRRRPRSSSSLDGTGVRVGVVSDGIRACSRPAARPCAGVDGGPIAQRRSADGDGRPQRERRADRRRAAASSAVVSGQRRSRRAAAGAPACAFAGRRRRRHGAARDRPRPRAGREAVVRQRRHRSRVQPGGQFSRRVATTSCSTTSASSASRTTAPAPSRRTPRAALNNPACPIRAYFTAVGNDADEHYYGTYVGLAASTARRSPGSRRPAICICSNGPPTRPTCSASARSRTT